MAVDFTDFTTGGTLASDNYLIGYDIDASGGEKKWKYDTLMRSISSDLTPELIHKINQNSGDGTVTSVTGTAPISVATGTTTPAISIAAATTSSTGVAELATLAEVQTGVGSNTIVTPADLNTLLQTLSTNIMNNLGNYPYLEYAWVTAPNAAGQSIAANTITTLTLNTEVFDTGSFGNISGNQITLNAGTYQFEANTHADSANSAVGGSGTLALYNTSNSVYVTRGSSQSGGTDSCDHVILKGQFTITEARAFDLRYYNIRSDVSIRNASNNAANSTITTANAEQRTTIKLWKVG